jgi:hypothetical protein
MKSGLKKSITKTPKAAIHHSRVVTSGKSPNSAMSKKSTTKTSKKVSSRARGVVTAGSSPNSQMTAKSTTKVPRVTGNSRVFGD